MQKIALAAGLMAAASMPRAITGFGIRADNSDPKVVLAALTKAFEDFKAENDTKLKSKADVVLDEKVEKVNAEVTRLQAAMDEQAAKFAQAQLGGGRGEPARDGDYEKLFAGWMRNGRSDESVAASENKGPRAAVTKTDGEGGYLAPIEWDRTLTGKLKQVSQVRKYASVQPISGAGFKKVFNDRVIGSGWVSEQAARPITGTPGLTTLDFVPGELYANPAASQGVIDDAEINIEQWLVSEIEPEFARQEGVAFLSGDGAAKPFGMLTYITGGANAAKHPWGAITTKNSGHATQLTTDGVLGLIYDLPQEFESGARLFANRGTFEAARKLKDGQGNYIWQPSFQMGEPATIAGAPVAELPGMPAIGAGAKAMLYGDMALTYLIVDRVGLRLLRDPFTNKPFVHFYTTKRVGGGVQNPEPMRALNISV